MNLNIEGVFVIANLKIKIMITILLHISVATLREDYLSLTLAVKKANHCKLRASGGRK